MSTAPSPGAHLALASKLMLPQADPRHVARDATVARVLGANARLVLISAPAGFGKTTVMAQCRLGFERSGFATAWLRLDETDNDPPRFLKHLHAALAPLLPDGGDAPALSPESPIGESALAFLDRIATLERPFALFLDDFESIRTAGPTSLVGQLIEALPPEGRLLIGTRSRPELRLGRLRASGALLEIGARELRFSFDETRSYFDGEAHRLLERADLELIHRRTEGWPAALWLARLALERETGRSDVIARFSGSDAGLAEYLADEVLSGQGEPFRALLLRTSILHEVSAPLCEALLPGTNASATLTQLAATNAFLTPVEGRPGCWRYHSLFASFLRTQLRRDFPDQLAALHRAAARAYSAQGRIIPAIGHLIQADDRDDAIRLLRPEAARLLKQGMFRLLARWLDALGPSAHETSTTLPLCHVWAVFSTRGPQAASALMQRNGIAESQRPRVRAHVPALQASLLSLLDRWEEGYEVARAGMRSFPSVSRYADAALVNAAAGAATVLGRFDEARGYLDLARRSQGRSASPFHRMYSEAIEGTIDLLEGRLRHARARFRLAMQATHLERIDVSDSNAWAGLLYAESVYEADDLRQAERLLQIYLPLARDAWLADHTVLGYVMLSRIAFADGDLDHAVETLTELEYLGHERRLERLAAAARLERARLLTLQGHTAAAQRELARADDDAVWERVATRRHLAHDCEDRGIGLARVELARGDAAAAKARLLPLLDAARRSGRTRRAMKLQLLLAAAIAGTDGFDAARDTLLPVIRWACAEDSVRSILDEGTLVAALVAHTAALPSHDRDEPELADFLERLRAACGPLEPAGSPAVLAGPDATAAPASAVENPPALTRSEIRLLQLLAEGHSNRALADRLHVSDSTVRTHLRNVNHKLGSRNRTEAVAMARRLGVIR